MTKLGIFGYSLLFLVLVSIGGILALQAYTNLTPISLLAGITNSQDSEVTATAAQCSSTSPLPLADQSSDAYLSKLAEYQQVCHSFVTNQLMIFTSLPTSASESSLLADKVSKELRSFSAAGVEPIVIVEPSTITGNLIDFGEIHQGLYATYTSSFFKTLRQQGITASQMGTWVPFPEPNTPQWNAHGFVPTDFSDMVNAYALALKSYYPTTKVSLLFNSTTYDASDIDYANGEYISFSQWINHIQPGLVDSFGIQGFPWLPRATTGGAGIVDANEFLNPRLLIEAATILKVKEVWFNTGTFYAKYTTDSSNTVYVSAPERLTIANSIVQAAAKLKAEGYSVWVNIFAQDKSETTEATDWSYWEKPVAQDPNQTVFLNFAHALLAAGIPLSLYDQSKSLVATPTPTVLPLESTSLALLQSSTPSANLAASPSASLTSTPTPSVSPTPLTINR